MDGWQWVDRDCTARGPSVGVRTSRRELTTSTVIIAGEDALLVDPAWDPDELDRIADDLARRGLRTSGFATHAHHDHVLWHPRLGGGPRWASPAAADCARTTRRQLIHALGDWPADLSDLVGVLTPLATPRLPWPAAEIRLIVHDAHSPGHTALWLAEPAVLVAGDMLSDVELPLLGEETLAEYAAGLAALRPFVDLARLVIPGHGRPATGPVARDRWAADQVYLEAVAAGVPPLDPRLALPGMAQAHRHNVSRAAAAVT